ncbi:hypothetical protein QVD99_001192 [Batrachochytrium dendrobatidis]|nr:hypothetical protein QVD99_001192 [Batrachochytrium dendrobatidis]
MNTINSSTSTTISDTDEGRRDVEFRKFGSAIERALQSFDSVSEWADVIGFLTRLGKIFQLNQQFSAVPKKLIVSKRLAQCLNPALPSGAHAKALEVYSLIFQAAGKAQMAEDLMLWSYGLFPFGAHAAVAVKPLLLGIYEKFYVPLGTSLRSALKGLILAIYPMLEEEGNEFFDKAVSILDQISLAVDHTYFFHALWLSIISASNQRLSAIHYILRRFSKMNSTEDMVVVVGSSTINDQAEILAPALVCLLSDKSALVQRGALELLVTHFPATTTLLTVDDMQRVVSAAVGVVLRRDMSLNRRLYSWILGSAEVPLRNVSTNISLVSQALKCMFYANNSATPISELNRPYKIIISLLDKPELGPLIMDTLFLDILRSLKRHCERSSQLSAELLSVATMLLDNLDAFFIWKQLHEMLTLDKDHIEIQDLELILFVLESFKFSDDETQRVHLPFLYQTISASLQITSESNQHQSNMELSLRLYICAKISVLVDSNVFSNSWNLREFRGLSLERRERSASEMNIEMHPSDSMDNVSSQDALCDSTMELLSGNLDLLIPSISAVYSLADSSDPRVRDQLQKITVGKSPLDAALASIRIFTDFFIRCTNPAECVLTSNTQSDQSYNFRIWDCLMKILSRHVEAGSSFSKFDSVWMNALVSFSTRSDADFSLTTLGLRTSFSILISARSHSRTAISHRLLSESNISLICFKLWNFLVFEHLPFHSDCVALILKLTDITGVAMIEDCITKLMSQGNTNHRIEEFYKFGIFWRHLERLNLNTCLLFSRPLLLVLDSLKSYDLQLQLSAQNWIQLFVKSYARVIPLLLTILTHVDICFEVINVRIDSEYVQVTRFTKPFNQAQAGRAFDILNLLLEFDDVNFLNSTMSSTLIQPWIESACMWPETCFEISIPKLTLLDTAIIISLRFILADFVDLEYPDPNDLCAHLLIQQNSCLFLQKIISRSSVMPASISFLVHDMIVCKLQICLLEKKLELQPHLLKILGLISTHAYQHYTFHQLHRLKAANDDVILKDKPLIVKTMLKAISSHHNRSMLKYWLNLVLANMPRFQSYFTSIVLPLFITMCVELRETQHQFARLAQFSIPKSASAQNLFFAGGSGYKLISDRSSFNLYANPEFDTLALLNGIKRMLLFSLQEDRGMSGGTQSSNDTRGPLLNITSIIGSVLVRDSLGSESANDTTSLQGVIDFATKSKILELMPGLFAILAEYCTILDRYEAKDVKQDGDSNSRLDDKSSIAGQIRISVKWVVEAVYKTYPQQFMDAIIEVWFTEVEQAPKHESQIKHASLSLLELISECSQKTVVNVVTEAMRFQLPYLYLSASASLNRDKSKVIKPIPDLSLCAFLEYYIRSVASSTYLKESMPVLIAYFKEACVQASSIKYIFPQLLCLIDSIFEKLQGMTTAEDKRMRREAEEILQRVMDYCILIIGRAFDQGSWRRVVTGDVTDSLFRDEKSDTTTVRELDPLGFVSMARSTTKPSEDTLIQETMVYFADKLIPNLTKLIQDNDRIVALSTNFTYYVTSPMLKSRHSMNKLFLNPVLDCICAFSQIPSSLKVCRKDLWEAFLDPRFFQLGSLSSKKWQKIMHAVMASDKERLAELLARISTTSSTTLFVSREQELTNRAQMLRRLSFTLYAAPKDFYLPYLPGIQEKIVEVFKNPYIILQLEGFFCLRILFCRISAKHMSNFWPMILSELIRVFSIYICDPALNKPDDLALLLAACKLVDILVMLGIEEFQWHQWLFITETCNMESYHRSGESTSISDLSKPASLLDRLGNKWISASGSMDDIPLAQNSSDIFGETDGSLDRDIDPLGTGHTKLRRPMISQRTIYHRSSLDWFVRHVSRVVYNDTLGNRLPDMDYLDWLLEQEFPDMDLVKPSGSTQSLNASGGSGSGWVSPPLGLATRENSKRTPNRNIGTTLYHSPRNTTQ